MRGIVLIVAALGFSSAAHAVGPQKRVAIARSLPIFEFMGQNTETATAMTELQGKACSEDNPNRYACYTLNGTLAGRPMRWLSLRFNSDRRLYYVNGDFGEFAHPFIERAFRAKYGPPQRVEIRKWQSKGGALFDNRVSVWRFRGGSLELATMGDEVGAGNFTFFSRENAPPAEAPNVDF